MMTAYDYPSACHLDAAGIEVCLIGDSVSMVVLGNDNTLPVSVDNMIYHCQAVSKGAPTPLLVGDLPFGSYENSNTQAYMNAIRYLKEGGVDCVKLEGGKNRAGTIKHLVDNGVAVMGHIGLTPQLISVLGGFRAQGKSVTAGLELLEDAKALEAAGCFGMVVECVPPEVAKAITEEINIPTFGIGAGPHCSGQVLVYHDVLGIQNHQHYVKVAPSFAKMYVNVGQTITDAIGEFKEEVENGSFPDKAHTPFKMHPKARTKWADVLANYKRQGIKKEKKQDAESQLNEIINVY